MTENIETAPTRDETPELKTVQSIREAVRDIVLQSPTPLTKQEIEDAVFDQPAQEGKVKSASGALTDLARNGQIVRVSHGVYGPPGTKTKAKKRKQKRVQSVTPTRKIPETRTQISNDNYTLHRLAQFLSEQQMTPDTTQRQIEIALQFFFAFTVRK
jgi:hypothetical protein